MVMTPYWSEVLRGKKTRARDGTETILPHELALSKRLHNVESTHGNYSTPNPHRFTTLKWTTLTGFEQEVFANGEYTSSEGVNLRNLLFQEGIPTNFNANVRSMALVDLYDQLRNSDIDLSVDLIQYRQVLGMVSLVKRASRAIARHALDVVPVADRTARAIRTLNHGNPHFDERRRRVREIDRSLNWLAERRLEYVYGWKPTASTIVDLGVLASTPPPQGMLTLTGRGTERTSYATTTIINGAPCIHSIILFERCKVVCSFSPSASTLAAMSQISSLNPVSILYEATPYSMCLDWFVGIGSWLRTMETAFAHSNNFIQGYQSRSYKWMSEMKWIGSRRTAVSSTVKHRAAATAVQCRFERTRLSSAPFPTRPVVKMKLGVEQLTNAISLAKVGLPRIDKLLQRK